MSKRFLEIDEIFHSKSVAIFGVSRKGGLGNLLLQAYIDSEFPKLFPINPKAAFNGDKILNLQVYPDLVSIDEPVDLVILATHPRFAKDILTQCGEKGVKAVILFSAGFGEKSVDGKNKQEELVQIAHKYNMRLIGPNCMGLYCPATKLSFFPSFPKEIGTVGFLSQSGSVASLQCFISYQRGLYFSKVVSFGNACDLDFNDFLYYLGEDPDTSVIGCYLEGVGVKAGQILIPIAKEVVKKKPVIIWKVGKTESGTKAASSHTGSICGNQEIWDSVFDQVGIISVNNIRELVEMIGAFRKPFYPKGNRVCIISGPGGPAVNCADSCAAVGLKLAEFSDKTKENLSFLPAFGTSIKNPIDVGLNVEPTVELQVLKHVKDDPNIDMFLFYFAILRRKQYKGLVKLQKEIQKPMAIVSTFEINASSDSMIPGIKTTFPPMPSKSIPRVIKELNENGIAIFSTEQLAAKALYELYRYGKVRQS